MKNAYLLLLTLVALWKGLVGATPRPLRIDGLVAAVFSPFSNDDYSLNVSAVNMQHAYLKSTGIEWVFVGGTTGESLSLSKEERMSLTKSWLETGINVIAHVGAECLEDAKELAVHAAKNGAKAIGAMPPVFFSPANAKALALTMSEICAAAEELPCYYYHIPSMSKYTGPMLDFVEEMSKLSENFVGIKYTGLYNNPAFVDAVRVMRYANGKEFGAYEVLGGREELMLESLAVGIRGFVGSQFNFAGDLYNSIHSLFSKAGLSSDTSEELRDLQFAGTELIASWQIAPAGMNGGKAFMNMAGVPVGPARLPSIPIDSTSEKSLELSLQSFCSAYDHLSLKVCAEQVFK